MELAVASAARRLEGHLPDWKLSYRIDEACAATGFGKSKMWALIRAGTIEAKKDGGVTIILRRELQRYLDNLPTRPART